VSALVIRRAVGAADAQAVRRLAALDCARALRGDVLVALEARVVVAAVEVDGGRAVADPFRSTAGAVALLRLRAAQVAAPERPAPPRRRVLRARTA
jgi:hypothetical protein